MSPCPYCHLEGEKTRRCSRCGWSPQHWPFQQPVWEREAFISATPSWFTTFWALAVGPRFFFQRLNPGEAPWGGMLFAFPVILLTGAFFLFHLPFFVAHEEGLHPLFEGESFVLLERFLQLGTWGQAGVVLWQVIQVVLQWLFLVAFFAVILQWGLRLSLRLKVRWRLMARLLGYTLTPAVACFAIMLLLSTLLSQGILWDSPPEENALLQKAGSLGGLLFFFAMFLWPYFLLLMALEETLGVSRFQAQMGVLAGLALGMFFLVFAGAVLRF